MGHIVSIKPPALVDTGHGVQAGDPGAEPPPANLELTPTETPSIVDTFRVSLRADRHQSAVIEMAHGFQQSVNQMTTAIRMLHTDDLATMGQMCRLLTISLRTLATDIERKLPKY